MFVELTWEAANMNCCRPSASRGVPIEQANSRHDDAAGLVIQALPRSSALEV